MEDTPSNDNAPSVEQQEQPRKLVIHSPHINSEIILSPTRDKVKEYREGKRKAEALIDRDLVQRRFGQVVQSFLENKSSIVDLLPAMFHLKGSPLTLRNHIMLEPLYREATAKKIILMFGRQSGKSTYLSQLNILFCRSIQHSVALAVSPLQTMAQKYSNNYVDPLLAQSPCKHLLIEDKQLGKVWQKKLINGSRLQFSYAMENAERTRGIDADMNIVDEIQNIPYSTVNMVHNTLKGSVIGRILYAGTPKTPENCIQYFFDQSSQAEWVIKCLEGGCGYWNIPRVDHDMLKMIGPVREDISRDRPGLVCAKCRKPLRADNPYSTWVHARAPYVDSDDNGHLPMYDFPGYHLPQPLLPLHNASPDAWRDIVYMSQGLTRVPFPEFVNECLGESYGVGVNLLTEKHLRDAAVLPWKNTFDEAITKCNLENYRHRCCGVDWGGYGSKGISYTVITVVGITYSGQIHVIWAKRLSLAPSPVEEAGTIVSAIRHFRCDLFAHDGQTMAETKESMIIQFLNRNDLGWLFRMYYASIRRSQNIMAPMPANDMPYPRYALSRSRTLMTVCEAIKFKKIVTFQYDRVDSLNRGLLSDLLSLTQEKTSGEAGVNPIHYVDTNPATSDDFAQALNYAACCLWFVTDSFPRFDMALFNSLDTENDVDPAYFYKDQIIDASLLR